jgi:hypothetical protein
MNVLRANGQFAIIVPLDESGNSFVHQPSGAACVSELRLPLE